MIDITPQTTELLQAVLSVAALVFVVMAASNKIVYMIRKGFVE